MARRKGEVYVTIRDDVSIPSLIGNATQAQLAQRWGISQTSVSRLISGERRTFAFPAACRIEADLGPIFLLNAGTPAA